MARVLETFFLQLNPFVKDSTHSFFLLCLSKDYLGCIIDCGDLPLKPEEVSTLFCNIEDIYEFNRWALLCSAFFHFLCPQFFPHLCPSVFCSHVWVRGSLVRCCCMGGSFIRLSWLAQRLAQTVDNCGEKDNVQAAAKWNAVVFLSLSRRLSVLIGLLHCT